MPPLDPANLIFPSAHHSISSTLTTLSRSHLTVSNRLRSIKHDAEFVEAVSSIYQLPLIANERCGSWYITPELKAGSAYFKSTDGHFGQWGFSLRRLNLGVLEVVGRQGGCIIVDSTRRGKSMPDALSKTVPIWVAVLNRLLFPDERDSHVVKTPQDVVSRSEHAQIEQRLPNFVSELRNLALDIDGLRSKLYGRPMEVTWATPDSPLSSPPQSLSGRNLVVLCTASGRTMAGKPADFDYVQGAADDHESWAHGLTPQLFWSNNGLLSSASEEELPLVIQNLVSKGKTQSTSRKPVVIKPTSNIFISDNAAAREMHRDFGIAVSCSEKPDALLSEHLGEKYIHLCCTTGKVGSRQLRSVLPRLSLVAASLSYDTRVLITCQTGRDLAVGVALALICLRCGNDGEIAPSPHAPRPLNKTLIKQRLSWIMVSMPDAVPSRATLQSVNAFLLG
ncbi:tRNA A64-2'-O-ribosylphosphate transferase [Saxophila tyrrhenica]|uniref:tRNA A64-2'-O-ribosylphosphate transferase n=1 Tax=Saxophila tyrrhenica TaxID=1690608 RepID=A0AAV9P4E0_9PEZI|nr:tRNA A64-2'-O-ribosylphosphate transferase [Saxophila tyrrhenica]